MFNVFILYQIKINFIIMNNLKKLNIIRFKKEEINQIMELYSKKNIN